jgi:hypothetical protein
MIMSDNRPVAGRIRLTITRQLVVDRACADCRVWDDGESRMLRRCGELTAAGPSSDQDRQNRAQKASPLQIWARN